MDNVNFVERELEHSAFHSVEIGLIKDTLRCNENEMKFLKNNDEIFNY